MFTGSISCFSMIISAVIAFLLIIPTLLISTRSNPDIPVLFRAVAVVFVILITVELVDEYCEFFASMVKTGIPKWFIALLFLISALYPCIKGIEAVSRAAMVGAVFVVLAVALIFALLPWKDISGFTDIDHSFSIKRSIDNVINYSPFLISIYFFKNIKDNRARSVTIPFIVMVFIFAAVMCFGKLLSVTEYEFIFYALSEISCHIMPMGFSGFFIAFSLICVYFTVVYFCHSVKLAIKSNTKLLSIAFILVIYGLSVLTMYNDTAAEILQNKYMFIGLFAFLAIFSPIAVVIKEKINA
ncbi:MAG: hypothetical protein IJV39_04350 [Ruminococcus sp.]|nr:hypothetical protein [Ruminococcus sp.]